MLDILADTFAKEDEGVSTDRLDSPVTCMRMVEIDKRYLIAGDEDGAVRIWDETYVHRVGGGFG
jgi:hypothetical protein